MRIKPHLAQSHFIAFCCHVLHAIRENRYWRMCHKMPGCALNYTSSPAPAVKHTFNNWSQYVSCHLCKRPLEDICDIMPREVSMINNIHTPVSAGIWCNTQIHDRNNLKYTSCTLDRQNYLLGYGSYNSPFFLLLKVTTHSTPFKWWSWSSLYCVRTVVLENNIYIMCRVF